MKTTTINTKNTSQLSVSRRQKRIRHRRVHTRKSHFVKTNSIYGLFADARTHRRQTDTAQTVWRPKNGMRGGKLPSQWRACADWQSALTPPTSRQQKESVRYRSLADSKSSISRQLWLHKRRYYRRRRSGNGTSPLRKRLLPTIPFAASPLSVRVWVRVSARVRVRVCMCVCVCAASSP